MWSTLGIRNDWTDQRDFLSVFLAEHLDQTAAMRVFLSAHPVERRRRLRIIRADQARELAEDARVLLFERDRERQHLGCRQVLEVASHGSGD